MKVLGPHNCYEPHKDPPSWVASLEKRQRCPGGREPTRDEWAAYGREQGFVDYEAAKDYHFRLKWHLTDSEDHRNHVANIVRRAIGQPIGEVTGDLDRDVETYLAALGGDE